jgi:hypothetical protein
MVTTGRLFGGCARAWLFLLCVNTVLIALFLSHSATATDCCEVQSKIYLPTLQMMFKICCIGSDTFPKCT